MKAYLKSTLLVFLFLIFSHSLKAGLYFGLGLENTLGSGIKAERIGQESKQDWYIMPNSLLANAFLGYSVSRYLDIQATLDLSTDLSSIGFSSYKGNAIKSISSSYNMAFIEAKPKYQIGKGNAFLVTGFGVFNGKNSYALQESATATELEDSYKGTAYKLGLGYEFFIKKRHSIMLSYTYTILSNVESDNNYYLSEDNAKEVNFNNKQAVVFQYKYSIR